MKTLDELYATRAPLPMDCPAMPMPPMGWDRWHYVGRGVVFKEALNRPWAFAFSWDRCWEIDYTGQDAPHGNSKSHYLIAVRDNEARRSLMRLYGVARKLAHTLSPVDAEVWNAIDDAEAVLGIANNEDS